MGVMDTAAGVGDDIYANFKPSAEDVKFLQQMLNRAGIQPPLAEDGVLGPKTIANLNQWQAANGLAATSSYDGTAKKQIDTALAAIGGGGTVSNVSDSVAGAIGTPETRTIAGNLSGITDQTGAIAGGLGGTPATGASKVASGISAGAANPAPLAKPTFTPGPTAGAVAGPGRTGGGATATTAAPVLPPSVDYSKLSDAEIDALIRRNFGALAWWMHEPDLAKEVRSAIREGVVDANQLAGRISQTEWWRKNSASVRAWIEFVHTSGGPGSANVNEAITRRRDEIALHAKKLGVNMTTQRAWDIAVESLKFNWSDGEIQNGIAAEFEWKGGAAEPGGQAGKNVTRLREIADAYLVPISDATLSEWTKNMLAGTVDEEMFRKAMVEQAKSLFPGLAVALDRGITVRAYANPYVELAARELEIAPDMIDLNDPKWSRPLFQMKDGQPVQMSLADWQTELRSNKQYKWHETKAARDQGYQFSDALLQEFGAIAR